jgi:hypothetical protein
MNTREGTAVAVGLLLVGGCSVPRVWTQQRIGPLDVDGDVAVSAGGGGAASSVKGLGFERDDAVWSPRVDFEWGGTHLQASYFESNHSGDGMAESDLQLGADMIMAGDPVTSDFDVKLLSGALTFDFVPGDFLDIALGIGGGVIEWDAMITETAGANTIRSSESFPIGFIAGRVASRISAVQLYLDAGALEISVDGDEVKYLDLDGGVAWELWNCGPAFGEVFAGYRLLQAELDYQEQGSDVDADLEFDGFYVGLSFGL